METPKHLGHKPLVSVNDYNQIDGIYRGASTDAKALSIGWAQYDNDDIAMKVWRHTGTRWSRQSEELPIHRNLDLTILLLNVLLGEESNNAAPEWKISGEEWEKEEIRKYYREHIEILAPRLKEIKELLNKMEL